MFLFLLFFLVELVKNARIKSAKHWRISRVIWIICRQSQTYGTLPEHIRLHTYRSSWCRLFPWEMFVDRQKRSDWFEGKILRKYILFTITIYSTEFRFGTRPHVWSFQCGLNLHFNQTIITNHYHTTRYRGIIDISLLCNSLQPCRIDYYDFCLYNI